jgi:starch phosphorylase
MPIVDTLLLHGDFFMLLADYRSYVDTQDKVDQLFADKDEWTRKTILNTANMGKFSSDRAVLEYASEIWGVQPLYK